MTRETDFASYRFVPFRAIGLLGLALSLLAAVPLAQATEIPFGPAEQFASGLAGGVQAVPVLVEGDLDGDGDADIVASTFSSLSSGGVWWFENLGAEGFAAEQLIAGCAEASFLCRANDIQLTDMDSDGDLDLLSVNFFGDTIGWFPNDGSGTFSAPTLVRVAPGAGFSSITAADLDGDGDVDVDVSAVNRSQSTIAWFTRG